MCGRVSARAGPWVLVTPKGCHYFVFLTHILPHILPDGKDFMTFFTVIKSLFFIEGGTDCHAGLRPAHNDGGVGAGIARWRAAMRGRLYSLSSSFSFSSEVPHSSEAASVLVASAMMRRALRLLLGVT